MEIIYGIGIDIVKLSRIEQIIQRWGNKFLQRTFTHREIEYCSSKTFPNQHYGARFAAKEAVFKALGTGWSHGVNWLDVEVCIDPNSGQPSISLSGKCLEILGEPSSFRVLVSLSHDREYAIAQAMILKTTKER